MTGTKSELVHELQQDILVWPIVWTHLCLFTFVFSVVT